MKILISGFLPFGSHTENSSQIIAEKFKTHQIDGFDIRVVILPVTFGSAFERLKDEIDSFGPDAVICMGLASNRKTICLEKVAVNFMHSNGPDNDGVVKKHEKILSDGPSAYFSTLPLEAMLEVEGAFPLKMSMSAGSFVCNETMFRLLDYLKNGEVQSGFIHLPSLKDDELSIFETVLNLIKVLK
jgi:pyroglutamyl-peptidase